MNYLSIRQRGITWINTVQTVIFAVNMHVTVEVNTYRDFLLC